jgi:MFS family permease
MPTRAVLRSTLQPPRAAHNRLGAHAQLRPLLVVWAAWLVLMMSANLATPLYAVYAARFGFSSLILTAIFAAYALVLIPSLLLFGRLSDRFGRRPVMLAGLVVACAGLAVFAAAQGTAWLFGARALQGLAVGLISSPATAALVEFDPHRGRQRPALLAGLAQAGGSAAGTALAGGPGAVGACAEAVVVSPSARADRGRRCGDAVAAGTGPGRARALADSMASCAA